MIDSTKIEVGQTIDRLKEMFGPGGGTRRIPYEVIEVGDDIVTVEPAEERSADPIELPLNELRDGWEIPCEDE